MSINDVPEYNGNMRVVNYLRWYGYKYGITSSEEMYDKYYDIKEKPKCIYCGNDCRFISFTKGYLNHCGSIECSRKSIYNGNTVTKSKNRQRYREYITNNLEFYKNVNFPFIDPYDNKIVENLAQYNSKSNCYTEIFDEKRECIFCKNEYTFNRFYWNKEFCNNRSCENWYNQKLLPIYKKFSKTIPFEIFKINYKKNRVSNNKLEELLSRYDKDIIYEYLCGRVYFVNGYVLKRNTVKDKFSFFKNNIIEDDMKANCKCCGKEYIKYDKIIVDDNIIIKKIGAEFSCGARKCYNFCIKYYERSEEYRKKQSETIKNYIKSGRITPCVTNSWTNRSQLKFNNIAFRSTWELYFYCFHLVNDIEILYESVRIPYYDSVLKKERVYIVDFYIPSKKEIVEIKPESFENRQNFLDKLKYANEYCAKNGLAYIVIDDKWFKQNFSKKVLRILPKSLNTLVSRLLEQFEVKNEN